MSQDPDHENPRDAARAEEAAWRSIVENFGERAELDEYDEPVDRRDVTPGSPRELFASAATPTEATRAEEHFVPPPPPPVPRADPPRLLAWVGLCGVPFVVLALLVAGVAIADWLGLILMVWFVGGFVFLVASMRSDPRDEDDDGAVL